MTNQPKGISPTEGREGIVDTRINGVHQLLPPIALIEKYPTTAATDAVVSATRNEIHEVLTGRDDRLLVISGPCSIHDPKAALDYAERLMALREQYRDDLIVIMRVYFEKPRTTVGWKGLINDPDLNESHDINNGLRIARKLLVDVNSLGMPVATEFLDLITPQYIDELISWGAIGARTTESQVHRQLASGMSCPIGFKNATDGNPKVAVDAVVAAQNEHTFMTVTKMGQVAIAHTRGNSDCHIILRGGSEPNYSHEDVDAAGAMLRKAGLRERVMIDFSHSNSHKRFKEQLTVCADVCGQLERGEDRIFGVMVESNLVEGRQDLCADPARLTYGQSVTDACIGFGDTVSVMASLGEAVRARRAAAGK
ncbi:MAG: 3-deoxy-7-phosphoheptulonate synthase [Succinivibrionaceae bacterium]|nr:3-deoxy-7-phosphoheptulonate synthase [Succinivibrionaceae bacterium]